MVIGTCLPSPIPTRPSGKSLTSPLRWQARIDAKFVAHDINRPYQHLADDPCIVPGRKANPWFLVSCVDSRHRAACFERSRTATHSLGGQVLLLISIMLERLKMVSKVFNLHTPSVPWSMCVKKIRIHTGCFFLLISSQNHVRV